MSRPNPLILIGVVLAFLGGLGWLTLSKGALYISGHEGDTFHHLDIIFRMMSGQWPHLDFVTPLGILAFAPFVYFMAEGYPVGQAILAGQVLVATVLAPFVVYVSATRLKGWVAYAFAAIMMIFAFSLIHGGTAAGLSISMHYNRWAWVIGSMIVVMGLLPGGKNSNATIDGLLFAVFFTCLVLLKLTFFVALLPGVVLSLLLQNRRKELVIALATGLVLGCVLALVLGLDFWLSYASDLVVVSSSEVRPHTGLAISDVLGGPEFIAISIVGVASALFLSRAGYQAQGISLLVFFPGFVFITWQNFGNDPKWLVSLAAVLLVLADKASTDEATALYLARLKPLGIVAALLFTPSVMNMAVSPLKHWGVPREDYQPMLSGKGEQAALYVRNDRGFFMRAETFLDNPGDPWDAFFDQAEREEPHVINGIAFPSCEFMAGSVGFLKSLSKDARDMGAQPGDSVFVADIVAAVWLYEPFEPVRNGAPWYYGGLSGSENVDFIAVPKCGFAERVRQIIIGDVAESGLPLETVAENERMVLFRVDQ